MDPSYRSPYLKRKLTVEDPQAAPPGWVDKFYQKSHSKGKFRHWLRIRNERTVAITFVVVCVGLFYFPIMKAIVYDAIECIKHPDQINIFDYYTEEEKERFRKQQRHFTSISDAFKSPRLPKNQPPIEQEK